MPPRLPLVRIVASYAIAASCWIFLTDHALHQIGDPETRLFLSLYKGWLFVALTSLLLALLLRRYHLGISRDRAEIDCLAGYSDTLSAVNQAIVANTDSGELYRRVCEALVEKGGFVLAWAATLEAGRIFPAGSAGPVAFPGGLDANVAEDSPVARALREADLVACEQLHAGASTADWQVQARALGLRAVAAMPFCADGELVGALCFGTAEPAFHPRALALLRAAALDLGLALEQLARGKRLRQALDELRHEHLYSETLLESMPGLVYFHDREGRFLRWNRHLSEATGYDDAELAQLPLHALFRAEDRPLLEARVAVVFEHGEATLEAPLRDRKDEQRPYFFTCRRISFGGRDCVIGVGLDVSVRRAAEEALRRSEERFREMADNMGEVFFHYDLRGGRLRYAGPAFERLYGESVAALYQEPERYIAALRAPLSETLANLPPGTSVESQHRIARDGEPRWIHEHAVPVRDAAGNIERVVGILRDVTESRNAQAAQQQLLVDLGARNQELQEFAFVASHDLQEPLRKIRAFSDLLTSRHADALVGEARQYVDRMQSAAERMQSLIDALLAYSRVAAGTRALEDLDLARVLREVWADLEARVLATGAELRHSPLPVLKADPTQMRQMLQNLLANALKFRDSQRTPVIRIDCTQAELDGRPAWQLCFSDNGIGFDPRHADRIFAPFHRLHSRSEYEGTGMGLAIVRRIVERHGGRIEAHAEAGVGARFTVTLPA